MKNKNITFILKDTTVEQAYFKIKDLPNRFQNYKCENTKWNILFYKQEFPNHIILTLVDTNFEVPRGEHYDTPLFDIKLKENNDDTLLTCEFKWRRWKKILMIIFSVFAFSGWGWLLYSTIKQFEYRMLALLLLFTIIPISWLGFWLVSNIKHDKLTRKVFINILKKIK